MGFRADTYWRKIDHGIYRTPVFSAHASIVLFLFEYVDRVTGYASLLFFAVETLILSVEVQSTCPLIWQVLTASMDLWRYLLVTSYTVLSNMIATEDDSSGFCFSRMK